MEKVDLLFSGYGRFQACSQDFLPEGQVSGVGMELGCLRLHFECFKELGIIPPNFNLQSNFLQIDYYILQLSRMTMWDVPIFKQWHLWTTHANRKWTFCNLVAWFDQNFRQIVSMSEKTLKRVSMGLTDRRKTAKNLADSLKNWKILAVNRVKKSSP